MLAEIAAANVAFATIKTALQNGKELYDCANSCATYFNNKSLITRNSKKNGNKTQFQAFMELEKLKKQEEWIREWMIYAGRSGLYDDWLKFQSECKRQRAAELNKQRRKKTESDKLVATIFKWTGGVILSMSVIFFGMWRIL
tara:strand:- start:281 stop:706 length:426 start_codon:yes stop_codon:yes gene_type:complete